MTLPSIVAVAKERGLDLANLNLADQELVLTEAIRRDLPLAVALLHRKAHEADENDGSASWLEDPKSDIGKQLTRVHASDAIRPLVSKHICHGKDLTFINCCGGVVGKKPDNILLLQIQQQAGPTAYADC
ncbi:MAG: hypothetical protein WAZ40_01445 [Minisyncoccia bacterium]